MSFHAGSSPRIVIVKPSSLGDVIHTLPLLRTLRNEYPSAYIAWVLEGSFRELLDGNTDLDEVIVVHTKKWRRKINATTFREIRKAIRRLRELRFDIAIDLQGLLKSGVITWITNAKVRLGFHKTDMRESINAIFLNKRADPAKPDRHAIERSLDLLKALGIEDFKIHFGLDVSPKGETMAENFLGNQSHAGPLVAINPGFGFRTKAWGLEKYAVLGDMLMEKLNCAVLLTWGPGERNMVERIAETMKKTPWILPPTSIKQSFSFFRRCDLFIGSDTGPMHICTAFGVKTLVLMGPTAPLRNGPFGEGHTVIQKDLPCKNCYKRKCLTMECMKSILVDEVFEAASRIIDNKF